MRRGHGACALTSEQAQCRHPLQASAQSAIEAGTASGGDAELSGILGRKLINGAVGIPESRVA